MGSLKAAACHWEKYKALGLLKSSPVVYILRVLSRVNLVMALISFHQCRWDPTLFISAWIHWWGWFTGFGIPLSHNWDWDQAVEGLAGTFGEAPPMWVRWCWKPSLQGTCGGSTGKGVEGLGVSSHSSTVPPARKVVRSVGSVGSLPKSSSHVKPGLFFFWSLGRHSSIGSCGGGMPLYMCGGITSLFPAPGFSWLWVQMELPGEQLSHSSAGCDHRGWERVPGACLDVRARDSGAIVTFPYPWNGNITFLIPITLSKGLLWDVWLSPPPRPGQGRPRSWGGMVTEAPPTLQSGPSQPWSAL